MARGYRRPSRLLLLIVGGAAALVVAQRPAVPARAAAEAFCSGENLAVGANWSVCWEVRANEGLAITHAFYVKDGLERRVLSDASVAQIFVPYESGHPRYHDVAYGLGPAMQPLTSGECPHGSLLYSNKVCRQIEDRGATERFCADGRCHVRLGQSLVLWGSSQMGAYNYLTKWEFHDDGAIQPAMGLSGILQFGDQAHTHNVYWRLDVDLDDADDDRVEEFYRIPPAWGDGSQGASGWVPLLGETYKPNDLNTFRKWRVVDTVAQNGLGQTP
jgi:primary-amine oxidase